MKKFLFLGIVCLLMANEFAPAQKLTKKDHLKYWYYRHRLLEEFVIVGEATEPCVASGLSIPSLKALYSGNASHLSLDWRENPVMGLGYYIGILATELKMLYLSGEPYSNTQQELYYAMKAYERIDNNCECLFYPQKESEEEGLVNGLFCRDDVPYDFLYDLTGHIDFRIQNNYSSEITSTYQNYRKEYLNKPEGERVYPLRPNWYPSMEEIRGLFTGFALLVSALKDCPAEVVIYNDFRFIDQAILHTQRYMDRLKNNDWIGKLTNDSIYHYGKEPKQGQQLYGLAKAADGICKARSCFAVEPSINTYRNYGADFGYDNPVTSSELYFYLSLLPSPPPIPYNVYIKYLLDGDLPPSLAYDFQQYVWMLIGDPSSHFMVLNNVGEYFNTYFLAGYDPSLCFGPFGCVNIEIDSACPGEEYEICGNDHVAVTNFAFAAIGNSWKDVDNNFEDITYESLVHYTRGLNWEFYPLLNLYLGNKNKSGSDSIRMNIVEHLTQAPSQGPHFLPYWNEPSSGTEGWRHNFRWNYLPEIANNGINIDLNDPTGWRGAKYPGLDYMLAYNLIWLECIQKGKESDFMETSYTNERDNICSVYSGSDSHVFYKYGELSIEGLTARSNIFILGEDYVTLTGDIDFAHGAIEIMAYPKLTFPMVESSTNP
jgi:hypothetical protein